MVHKAAADRKRGSFKKKCEHLSADLHKVICKYVSTFIKGKDFSSTIFFVSRLVHSFRGCQFWRLHHMHIIPPIYWNIFWPFLNNKSLCNLCLCNLVWFTIIPNLCHHIKYLKDTVRAPHSTTISKNEQRVNRCAGVVHKQLQWLPRVTQNLWEFPMLVNLQVLSPKSEEVI